MNTQNDKNLALICRLIFIATICRTIYRRTGDVVILYGSMICLIINIFLLLNYLIKHNKLTKYDKNNTIAPGTKSTMRGKSGAVLGVSGAVYCISNLWVSVLEYTGNVSSRGILLLVSGAAIATLTIAYLAPKI
ncbi:MAG: hypothetical protein FWG88_01005 [Oscillospiraceae bacterium]|nr:hypothetical protein [Oscillospiraceae bacterium]